MPEQESHELGTVVHRNITEEMQEAYLDYAMSVIIARALPDVRDGLKPVHRRILYAMWDIGLKAGAKFRKSATVVGEVLGKYHPHGDAPVYDALVRMAQDFAMRTPLVNGQGNFGCFTKETKVKLTDGRDLSFEDLVREHEAGKTNYTYTVNKLGLIAIAKIQHPRKTRLNEELVRVALDNGESVRCTPDHLFMTLDGSYTKAAELKAGQSLMPLYEKLSTAKDRLNRKGYRLIYQSKKKEWMPAHHLADNYNLSHHVYQKNSGRVRHPVDFNKLNNNPDNVRRVQWGEHFAIHSSHASAQHKDSTYRIKIADGRKAFWTNEMNRKKYAERLSKRNTKNWQDPAYQEKMRDFLSKTNKEYLKNHPEAIEKISQRASVTLKRLWKDENYRSLFHEKIIAANKRRITNNTGKAKFLRICRAVLAKHRMLSKELYEGERPLLYPYGMATTWDTGLSRYYQNKADLVLHELNKNHKVARVERLSEREDVYDLTIDGTHNFALACGIFVHNSMDGDSAAAMRYCVVGDTKVVTERGLVDIGSISSREEISLTVLSKDRTSNHASKWFDSGTHPVLKITTAKGYAIEGSRNHPILVWTKDAHGMPTAAWKTLSSLQEGDVAILDRSPDMLWPAREVLLAPFLPARESMRGKEVLVPMTLNGDIAFLFGSICAEGSFGKARGHKKIEFCNTDQSWLGNFVSAWERSFPITKIHRFERMPSSYGRKSYARLEIHSQWLITLFERLGLSASPSPSRRVPESIFKSPKKVAARFLQAYFEGDGSVSFSGKMNELSCRSASDGLMSDIQILLLRFGIESSKRFDKSRAIHKLYIRGYENYVAFRDEINFLSDRKRAKLNDMIARIRRPAHGSDHVTHFAEYVRENAPGNTFVRRHNFDRYPAMRERFERVCVALREHDVDVHPLFESLLANHYLFDPIVAIEQTGEKRVFSIKVDSECHSFIGNGFINHNTEAKLTKIAEELLLDIEKETVGFIPNYDGAYKEPVVLPAKIPNLLLNGTVGIAVGMATNIPPHNISEICQALIHLIDNHDATIDDLIEHVKGPDFPTGGIIYDVNAIKQAYTTGRGGIVMRAKTDIIENKNGMFSIIVTEVPYQVNKASVLEKIAELVREKKVDGIKDLRDESNKDGVRMVIELKKDAYPKKVLNALFKFTQLQDAFHFNMLALVDGIQPRVLNLKMVLEEFLKHRKDVVTRRTQYDLDRARERAHILEGLKIALDNIDAVIRVIKTSKDRDEARDNLTKKFKLSERQSIAILEMRLQQLANLERLKIENELLEKRALIKDLEAILSSPKKILGIIKTETEDVLAAYGQERRTAIVKSAIGAFQQEDLIPNEATIVMITRDGYIKRLPPDTFKLQARGGKGIIGLTTKEEDTVDQVFTCMTHNDLLFFTTKGRVFQLKAYDVPLASRTAKGQAVVNFLQLAPNEKVTVVLSGAGMTKVRYLLMVTREGLIKKTDLSDFANVRRSGLIAIKLKGDDMLEWVKPTSGKDEVMLVTASGQSIRFKETNVRPMGRTAAGVRGVRLKKNDSVVGMDVVSPSLKSAALLIVTQKGLGKRSPLSAYKMQNRGGSGIKTGNVTPKTGPIVMARVIDLSALPEGASGDLLIMSAQGQVIRIQLKTVPVLGRATQGVRVMRFKEGGDSVASVTLL